MCESRRTNEPDDVTEWAMYLGTLSNVEGHFRVYIPARGTVYSRRSFKIPPHSSAPGATASAAKERGFSPRLKAKDKTQTGEKEDEKAELEAEEVLRKMMKDVNVDVQAGREEEHDGGSGELTAGHGGYAGRGQQKRERTRGRSST